MTKMQEWAEGMQNPERVVNEDFDTLAFMAVYGKNPATTTALLWGYYGGQWSGFDVDADVLTLTDNAVNYIVVDRSDGSVSVSTSNTNWNDTDAYGRVYAITTASGLVTVEDDRRGGLYGVHGDSGAAGADTTQAICVACGDETTAITTGTAKVTFRLPFDFNLLAIKASLTTAQSSGSIFTVDVNAGGSSILSTKLTIDNTEKTSKTAATPAVISTGSPGSLLDDTEVTIDVDQVGNGTAAGLKVYLIGKKI